MPITPAETLRDLRRDVRRRFHALVIAPNANLPDKGTYDTAVAEMVEVAAHYGAQTALRSLFEAIARIEVPQRTEGSYIMLLLKDELERAILPEAPPEP
jgi:hypothetical protein